MKYNAFISYSHHQDSDLAPSLEKGLEQFAKPTFKRRALHVFRDSNDLSASPDLWGKIQEGLSNSHYFIFLASKNAAESKWCKKEVVYWKESKAIDNFLIVLTDGELIWDEDAADFDWSRTNSIPKELSGCFSNEPLFVDFRGNINAEDLTLDNPHFKEKVVLLAATLHGRSVGDMVGEDVKQHRRTIRIRNSAIALLSFLLIGTTLSAFYAFDQQAKATRETQKATASNYLASAQALYYTDKTESMNQAYRGLKYADSLQLEKDELSSFLLKVLLEPGPMHVLNQDLSQGVQECKLFLNLHAMNGHSLVLDSSQGSHHLLLFKANGEEILIGLDSDEENRYDQLEDKIKRFSFSPKGNLILVETKHFGDDPYYSKCVYNLNGDLYAISYTVEGKYNLQGPERDAAISFDENENVFLSLDDQEFRQVIHFTQEEDRKLVISNKTDNVTSIALDKEGINMAYGTQEGYIQFIKVNYRVAAFHEPIRKTWRVNGHNNEKVTSLHFSNDSKYLVSKSASHTRIWPIDAENRGVLFPKEDWDSDTLLGKNNVLFEQGEWASPSGFKYVNGPSDTVLFDNVWNYQDENTKQLKSKNEAHTLTLNGLFDSQDRLIVPINLYLRNEIHHHNYSHASFSTNGKYLVLKDDMNTLRYDERLRIYMLDPEMIIEQIKADTEKFGVIIR